jgi:hypothetical protein
MKPNTRVWLARIMIGMVTAWNLQAALVFIGWPQVYTPGFMLSGVPGETVVRGVGVLFVMWNIPYLVAIWQPVRYRLALQLALAMQITGVLGECLVFFGVPAEYALLQSSLLRFIAFDTAGVLLLGGAYLLVRKEDRHG